MSDKIMNIGVIFAGGVGSRMHSKDRPKQFLEIFGKPIIIHTLEHFERNDEIDAVVVSCVGEWIDYLKEKLAKFGLRKVVSVVEGGKTGQLSIYNGLSEAKRIAGDKKAIALIHDGVRPLINGKLISENIACVKQRGSAITAGVVKETIVVVEEGKIEQVPTRDKSRVAKAPQSFWLDDILSAHKKAMDEGIYDTVDSCTLMQRYGYPLYMVDGPYDNIKITTPDDYYAMRAILQAKEDAQIYGLED